MASLDFRRLSDRLVDHVKSLIRRGELTERRLARLTGYSQPHVHNVLAGVRGVNIRFADDLLKALGLSLDELSAAPPAAVSLNHVRVPMCPGELSPIRGFPKETAASSTIFVPAYAVAHAAGALAMRVGADEHSMWPTIWPHDVVVIDPSRAARLDPDVEGVYVLRIGGHGRLCRCRKVGTRLLTLPDHGVALETSQAWISLDQRDILDVVRGRVVWVSRSLEDGLRSGPV